MTTRGVCAGSIPRAKHKALLGLAPAAERAVTWIDSLFESGFIGTERRLLMAVQVLEQIEPPRVPGDRSTRVRPPCQAGTLYPYPCPIAAPERRDVGVPAPPSTRSSPSLNGVCELKSHSSPSGLRSTLNPIHTGNPVSGAASRHNRVWVTSRIISRMMRSTPALAMSSAVVVESILHLRTTLWGTGPNRPALSDTLSCTPFMHVDEKPANGPSRSLTGTP